MKKKMLSLASALILFLSLLPHPPEIGRAHV